VKKKLIVYLLTVALLACSATWVCASEFKTEGNSITFEVTITPNRKASMIVVRAGTPIDNNDNIFAVKETTADENGSAVFEFDMYDGVAGNLADGEYDVYVKEENGEKTKYYFVYASETTKSAIESDLKLSVADTVSNTANLTALKGAGFNMDGYSGLVDTSKIAQMTEEYISEEAVIEDYANAFNLAVAVAQINSDKASADVLASINLRFDEKNYNDITDEALKNWINSYFDEVSEVEDIDDFISQYQIANILNIINNTRHTSVESVLNKYKSQLGITSSSEYKKYLSLSSKTNANAAFETKVKLTPVKNVEELKNVLDSVSKSTGSLGSLPGGGSSGGSSSGGSGSNSFPSGGITSGMPSATVNTNVTDGKFSDLNSVKWAEDAINEMAKADIVSGDGTGKFRPNDTMKREEFVKMLILALGKYDPNAECEFSDATKDAWYYRYIASAYNAGIIYGVSDTEFGVGNELTRQDMAVICHRAAELSGELEPIRDGKDFADAEDISSYAAESVQKLYKSGNINGVDADNFSPLTNATRAQGALIIYNLFLK